MTDINNKIYNTLFLGAMAHVTSPEFAALCLDLGINVELPSVTKLPEDLRRDIALTRILSKNKKGLLGVNLIMNYGMYYKEHLEICNQEKVDFIVISAGLDKAVFNETEIDIIVKVSFVNLAQYAEKLGAKALVIMGAEAGGHIGFPKQKNMLSTMALAGLIRSRVKIPLIASGGIVSKDDVDEYRKLKVEAFHLGTRFMLTKECPIDDRTKQAYLNSAKEDIILVESTIGLPLRVLNNSFTRKILSGNPDKPTRCINCFKNCSKDYCLQERIALGMKGDVNNSLLPASANTYKIKHLLSIRDVCSFLT